MTTLRPKELAEKKTDALRLVIFCHPQFLSSQSMPRFAQMLKTSFEARGHAVEMWSPRGIFKWVAPVRFSKWGGYLDQYVLFPIRVRMMVRRVPRDTLFVFCDQALGPWMPLVKHRPHVVHVHDLLALRSALGDFRENRTSMTGRIYQRFIRRGFQHARNFVSISNKTRDDLHRFGEVTPRVSEVVYNGLNFPYSRMSEHDSAHTLREAGLMVPPDGMLLHVGGGQWYKNLAGVISLYAHYAAAEPDPLPLWCVGPDPRGAALAALKKVPQKGRVLFVSGLKNPTLQAMYSRSRALLFPSLAEGFGWPIIEAQSCGCPVVTTGEPPMSEIAGTSAVYLPRLMSSADMDDWASRGSLLLRALLEEEPPEKARRVDLGYASVRRFTADGAIEGYLAVYRKVLDSALSLGRIESGLNSERQA